MPRRTSGCSTPSPRARSSTPTARIFYGLVDETVNTILKEDYYAKSQMPLAELERFGEFPELADTAEVHKLKAGRPGGYPEPIVDHGAERAEALRRYGLIR